MSLIVPPVFSVLFLGVPSLVLGLILAKIFEQKRLIYQNQIKASAITGMQIGVLVGVVWFILIFGVFLLVAIIFSVNILLLIGFFNLLLLGLTLGTFFGAINGLILTKFIKWQLLAEA